MITDESKKESPYKRRQSFATDGIEGFDDIIPGGQVGKGRGSAGNGRVKGLGPEVALRAVYRNGGNPSHGLAEIKGMRTLKGRRDRGRNSLEVIIKGIYIYAG